MSARHSGPQPEVAEVMDIPVPEGQAGAQQAADGTAARAVARYSGSQPVTEAPPVPEPAAQEEARQEAPPVPTFTPHPQPEPDHAAEPAAVPWPRRFPSVYELARARSGWAPEPPMPVHGYWEAETWERQSLAVIASEAGGARQEIRRDALAWDRREHAVRRAVDVTRCADARGAA